jgi:hypothetical protein
MPAVAAHKPKRWVSDHRFITVEIDLSDELDELEGPDDETTKRLLRILDQAKRCLTRRERTPAEALIHVESAIAELERML